MDFVGKKKISPEKRKERTKKLKCRICGKTLIGRETLARHISHAHNKIDRVKREKIVIDTYYGKGNVDKVIADYQAGKYHKISELPIRIYTYLNLAGIEKGKPEKEEPSGSEKTTSKKDIETKTQNLILQRKQTEDDSATVKYYVEDAFYDEDDAAVVLLATTSIKDSISLAFLRKFIRNLTIEDSKILIEVDKKRFEAKKVELKKNVDKKKTNSEEDKADRSSEQCVVTF